MPSLVTPIRWQDEALQLLDQRILPMREEYVTCHSLQEAHTAIRDMVVRGAPCIGFSAIYALALSLKPTGVFRHEEWKRSSDFLKTARPTAVNLMYEVERVVNDVLRSFPDDSDIGKVRQHVLRDAASQVEGAYTKNLSMAETALAELTRLYGDRPLTLMTHCNTGVLACGVLGTALGVISHAHSKGRVAMVYADETRPYMQGSRLTAYELGREKIPYHLVVEGAASWLFTHKKVDAIFVGADRIAANGDTANKVGTSTLAIVARHFGIPFFVVAPLSSFDFSLPDGLGIEIELRNEEEILAYQGLPIAPMGAKALNPSFDVTPASLISGIISEKGLVRNPDTKSMGLFSGNSK